MSKKLLLFLFGLVFMFNLSNAQAKDTLTGAGATFPYPVYSAWAHDYYKATGIKLNYQAIGSGGGIRQISSRVVDFGASDAPLKPTKLNEKKLLQFPAVIGGVVPIINIKGIEPGKLKLTGKVLAEIFLGDIKKWNDKRITDINKNINLPDAEISVVHRSDGSGTTAIFTTYLSAVSPEWKTKIGHGKAVKWPVGLGGKGNPGVANYVKRVKNSIGYVEFAYATENKLAYIVLKNKAGKFTNPSFEAFQSAAKYAKWDKNKGYYLWLVNADGAKSWPIAGATFILLAKEKTKSNIKTVKFYDWAFKNGDATAKKLIYVPLPKSLKDDIRSYWRENKIYQ
jgi:phosphate transport system substrate-binding protein